MTVRVLLADPEPLQRDGWRLLFEAVGAEVVVEAGDGVHALAMLRRERVDVAVIDVRMPRLDGVRLVTQARNDARVRLVQGSGVRYVLVTAIDLDRYVGLGAEAGADAVLPKDAPAETLLAQLRAS